MKTKFIISFCFLISLSYLSVNQKASASVLPYPLSSDQDGANAGPTIINPTNRSSFSITPSIKRIKALENAQGSLILDYGLYYPVNAVDNSNLSNINKELGYEQRKAILLVGDDWGKTNKATFTQNDLMIIRQRIAEINNALTTTSIRLKDLELVSRCRSTGFDGGISISGFYNCIFSEVYDIDIATKVAIRHRAELLANRDFWNSLFWTLLRDTNQANITNISPSSAKFLDKINISGINLTNTAAVFFTDPSNAYHFRIYYPTKSDIKAMEIQATLLDLSQISSNTSANSVFNVSLIDIYGKRSNSLPLTFIPEPPPLTACNCEPGQQWSTTTTTEEESLPGICVINNNETCTSVYNPVCGCDLMTYANACEARKAGIKIFKNNQCFLLGW